MKKIFILTIAFMFFILGGAKADAKELSGYVPHKITVKFQDDFSTKNPTNSFSVEIPNDHIVRNTRTIKQGTIFYLEVDKVNKEKRGKRNANVIARIVKVYIPSENKTIDVKSLYPNARVKFSQYEKLDVVDKSLDVGISVANIFVQNIAYPAHFVKGVVKNETGNRLKSGAKETFDSSVLSYATTGQPLELKRGDLATLTYYMKDVNDTASTANTDELNEIDEESDD